MLRKAKVPGPQNCAQFCAPSPSKIIASGHNSGERRGAGNQQKIQRDSSPSHSIARHSGRSLNLRVPGSIPGRLTTHLQELSSVGIFI